MALKRKSTDEAENTGGNDFRTTSAEEESLHRMKLEYQQMLLVLDNTRKENSDIIQQARIEFTRLRKEKEDVIKQSVDEIARLRRALDVCNQAAETVATHVGRQSEIIEYLRMSLARSESFNSGRLDSFNHVWAC